MRQNLVPNLKATCGIGAPVFRAPRSRERRAIQRGRRRDDVDPNRRLHQAIGGDGLPPPSGALLAHGAVSVIQVNSRYLRILCQRRTCSIVASLWRAHHTMVVINQRQHRRRRAPEPASMALSSFDWLFQRCLVPTLARSTLDAGLLGEVARQHFYGSAWAPKPAVIR